MLMIKNTLAWLIERSIELVLGACLLLFMGPNASGRPFADPEDFRQDIWLVAFFFVASGYSISTAWFGAIRRSSNIVRQSWINVALFSAHAILFVILAHVEIARFSLTVVLGVCVVAFSSLVGGSLRTLIRLKPAGVERQS